jgi:uncharacterized protein
VRISNEAVLEARVEDVWDALDDLGRVAACFPGAALTSSQGDTHEGRVRVRLGPMTVAYAGTATVVERDEAQRRARLDARGTAEQGNGTARADVVVALEALAEERTRLTVETDLSVDGRLAQFGQGVLSDVSARLFEQFSTALAQMLAAPDVTRDGVVADGGLAASEEQGPALDALMLAGPVLKRIAPVLLSMMAALAILWGVRRRRRARSERQSSLAQVQPGGAVAISRPFIDEQQPQPHGTNGGGPPHSRSIEREASRTGQPCSSGHEYGNEG